MVNDKGEIIMEKTLAVVGAGIAAVPIVRKAKELGIKTIGFGEFDSLAKDEFDLFVEKSIFDIEGLVDLDYLVMNVVMVSALETSL